MEGLALSRTKIHDNSDSSCNNNNTTITKNNNGNKNDGMMYDTQTYPLHGRDRRPGLISPFLFVVVKWNLSTHEHLIASPPFFSISGINCMKYRRSAHPVIDIKPRDPQQYITKHSTTFGVPPDPCISASSSRASFKHLSITRVGGVASALLGLD